MIYLRRKKTPKILLIYPMNATRRVPILRVASAWCYVNFKNLFVGITGSPQTFPYYFMNLTQAACARVLQFTSCDLILQHFKPLA